MKTRDNLPRLANENEVFVEVHTSAKTRGLLRRRLVLDKRGLPYAVESDLMATFHARIIGVAVDGDCPDDARRHVYTVAVKSEYGSKLIQFPARAFDGSANGTKLFLKRLYSSCMTGFVYPGKAAATVRAVIALSREGAPMP